MPYPENEKKYHDFEWEGEMLSLAFILTLAVVAIGGASWIGCLLYRFLES